MESPKIVTERLLLRQIVQDDLGFVFRLYSAHETNRYSSYGDLASMEDARKTYEKYLKPGSPSHFRVAVELKAMGEVVGTLGFYNYSEDNRRAELGYDLFREHWGRGYMTEAVKALLDYGFLRLNLNRMEATVDSENQRSIRLLERLGFVREGCLRERFHYKNRCHDDLVFGMLRKEWPGIGPHVH
jgi:RimJ/RimL family protein N-acetyltransferase